jgi:uncharacterized protein (TIGR00255 family)
MIKSMTGFGKSTIEMPDKVVSIEIKSLNSKQLDLNTRLPSLYREKDLEIRSFIGQKLHRGKIDLTLIIEPKGEETNFFINKKLALKYFEELKELSALIPEQPDTDYLRILVRMPDVLRSEKEELDEQEWNLIRGGIDQTLSQVTEFRDREGKVIEDDFRTRINLILEMLDGVKPFEDDRIRSLREKIVSQLSEIQTTGGYDPNRLEQEMIYYLEKLDITEEKIRLRKHCEYFLEVVDQQESNGKKLSFIAQEIGREINTLGSKANDVHIQKLVIQMKDELEKIKEQLLNIL